MADPGFSEWEAMLFGQMGGVLAILTKNFKKMRKFTPKWGAHVLHTLLTRFHVKNTETNIVFNDDYIVINYIET